MRKYLYFLFFVVLLSYFTLATEYYADQEIEIFENGDAFIIGTTNLELFSDLKQDAGKIQGITKELTLKKGKYWLVDYSSEISLSNFIVKIRFSKDVKINHISSKSKLFIESEDGTKLTFIGENIPLDIKVQYSFSDNQQESFLSVYWLYFGFLIFIILIIWVIFGYKGKKPKIEKIKEQKEIISMPEQEKKEKQINKEKLDAVKLTLNETQLKIIDALLSQKGECSQTKLRYLTDVPKASLSRNLELMAQKNIIAKFYNGTSNYIKIHVSLYELF